MDYLSKTLPIFAVEINGVTHSFQWDEITEDEYEGPMAEVRGELTPVTAVHGREAQWWTVAVYTLVRLYGGPEEGGWYYSAGQLTEHGRVRFFDDYAAAEDYRDQLWDWVQGQNGGDRKGWDEKLTVRCTTEALPDSHYPLKRPYYS